MARSRQNPRTQIPVKLRHQLAIAGLSILTIISIIICGYGHAAFNTTMLISGEATVMATAPTKPFGIDTMQEMTTAICAAAEVDTTQRLTDTRDGKQYWVAKLKDGNCWMTQNLNFAITNSMISSGTINSTNTDLHYSSVAKYATSAAEDGSTIYTWNASSAYPPVATYEVTWSGTPSTTGTGNKTTRSWYWPAGIFRNSTGGYSSTCANNVSSFSANSTCAYYFSQASSYPGTDWSYATSNTVYNASAMQHDAHFEIGTYYQFLTATAGSMYGITGTTVSSICPKGWQLPANGSSTTNNKSLINLLRVYSNVGSNITYNGTTKDVGENPLYIIRAGWITNTNISYPNIIAGLWSNSSGSTANAYAFRINNTSTTSVEANRNATRYVGYNIRCVAR